MRRPFKPAPEPKPVPGSGSEESAPRPAMPLPGSSARRDPEAEKELVRATADLGFSRESHAARTSAPEPTPPTEPVTPPEPEAEPDPAPARAPTTAKRVAKKPLPAPVVSESSWSIKFDADDTLYTELLLESRKRRVTLKYLILEILKAQGYTVDLDKAQQDGRRNR